MDVLMPQLGETVAEGKITKWFKSAGDAVKPGDNLFEIETDKVSMEVPSTTAGVLSEIRVGAGEVAPVGAVVAVIAGAARAPRRRSAMPPRPPLSAPRRAAIAAAAAWRRLSSPLARDDRHAICAHARRADRADPARSVLRGAHARAQLRPGAAARRRPSSRRWRGGWRRKPASISRASTAPGRTAASSRATLKRRRRAGDARGAVGHCSRRERRAGQGALSRRAVRGGAARRHAPRPSPRGWCRRSRPSRISI